jgi:hypothetical protein
VSTSARKSNRERGKEKGKGRKIMGRGPVKGKLYAEGEKEIQVTRIVRVDPPRGKHIILKALRIVIERNQMRIILVSGQWSDSPQKLFFSDLFEDNNILPTRILKCVFFGGKDKFKLGEVQIWF